MGSEIVRRERLERAVLALAQPADVQLSLFPDFVCKADELALDFEEALDMFFGHEAELADHERVELNALDRLILSKSGEANAAFWTDDALLNHPTWDEIRVAAKSTVSAFGWVLRRPPPSGAIYIGSAP
jgi:acetoin utilization deacetylase AcuC-like enzyme